MTADECSTSQLYFVRIVVLLYSSANVVFSCRTHHIVETLPFLWFTQLQSNILIFHVFRKVLEYVASTSAVNTGSYLSVLNKSECLSIIFFQVIVSKYFLLSVLRCEYHVSAACECTQWRHVAHWSGIPYTLLVLPPSYVAAAWVLVDPMYGPVVPSSSMPVD